VIAHSLSLLCRYGGHCQEFYSVAEHCVNVSFVVSPENALWGLLHDAAEGLGLIDMPRPVKSLLRDYYRLEEGIMRAVAERFNLPWPMPDDVKQADEAVLSKEKDAIMVSNFDWGPLPIPADMPISCWPPALAKEYFLRRFHQL
jgi:hypothetical protein